MERVVCIPQAKVRIVKVWDPELELACDMNVNNVAAIENTRMIRTYIQIDERVRPLAMIIKHWTKQRLLNDAGIGGTISSYTWICLIINFLQTRNPPILPALHNPSFREPEKNTGQSSHSSFADDLEKLRGFGASNKESVGQLLFHFFRVYGYEIDYEKEAISIRQGKRIPREEKGWHPGGGQKEGRIGFVSRSLSTLNATLAIRPMTTLGTVCIWRFDEPSIYLPTGNSLTRHASNSSFLPSRNPILFYFRNQRRRRLLLPPVCPSGAVEEGRIIVAEEVDSI